MNNLISLWDDAIPADRIPAYPGFQLRKAKGGEQTWEIDAKVKIGVVARKRKARAGELLRDPDLKYIPDWDANLEHRIRVRQMAEGNPEFQELQRILCKSSILYYCNTFCWTFDPRLNPSPHIPFVTFPSQDDLLTWMLWILAIKDDGLVEKSRDMGATWLLAVKDSYLCNFFPGVVGYKSSLREEDVDNKTEDSLLGKFRYIQRNLPPWLQNGWNEGGDGDVLMKCTIPRTRSILRGQKTESTGGRQGRAMYVDADEFAHITDGAAALEAFSSLASSRFFVSTPKGKGNEFARMAEDPRVKKKTMHWTLHPLKNQEWAQKERAKPMYTEEIWAQEQEIQYEKSTIGRIFPQFLSVGGEQVPWIHVHSQAEGPQFRFDPHFDVLVAADFGFGDPTSLLFAQIRPVPREFEAHAKEMIFFFDEEEDRRIGVWETRFLLNERSRTKGYRYRDFVGDMRTLHQTDSEGKTWHMRLRSIMDGPKYSSRFSREILPEEIGPPIFFNGKYNSEWGPIETMRTAMQTPGLFCVSKEGCPNFIRALQTWSFPIDPKTRLPRTDAKPEHSRWSHACKAGIYLMDWRYAPESSRFHGNRQAQWNFKTPGGLRAM